MPFPSVLQSFSEKSTDSLMGGPLYVTLFLLVPLEFDLNFAILIMICLAVGLFGVILFGNLCAFCTLIYVSFLKFGQFSPVILSYKSSSGRAIMPILDKLDIIQKIP